MTSPSEVLSGNLQFLRPNSEKYPGESVKGYLKILLGYGLGMLTVMVAWHELVYEVSPTRPTVRATQTRSEIAIAVGPSSKAATKLPEKLEIKRRPSSTASLPFPELVPETPSFLRPNEAGILRLEWTPIRGAARYRAYVFDRSGKVLFTQSTALNVIYINQLRDHAVQGQNMLIALRSLDPHGNEGPLSLTREIHFEKTPCQSAGDSDCEKFAPANLFSVPLELPSE